MKILILGKNTLFFFIDDIRKLSIIKKGTYLNTAYMGLMSMSLSNYRRDYEKGYLNEEILINLVQIIYYLILM